MIVLNENEYLFLDGSVVKPFGNQEDGNYFFEVKVPESYWDNDVETGLLQEKAQEWAVETACIYFNLDQKDYFPSIYPWEERLCVALIPVSQVPDYVKADSVNYWYDFEWGVWTKIN